MARAQVLAAQSKVIRLDENAHSMFEVNARYQAQIGFIMETLQPVDTLLRTNFDITVL